MIEKAAELAERYGYTIWSNRMYGRTGSGIKYQDFVKEFSSLDLLYDLVKFANDALYTAGFIIKVEDGILRLPTEVVTEAEHIAFIGRIRELMHGIPFDIEKMRTENTFYQQIVLK